mmetsp:Transcript_6848/g.13460  ORF Transcript_6848/g.13460 Transcript_6848/m.13460 type:complete len:215 (-) Transcript_6848:804-1448(-)
MAPPPWLGRINFCSPSRRPGCSSAAGSSTLIPGGRLTDGSMAWDPDPHPPATSAAAPAAPPDCCGSEYEREDCHSARKVSYAANADGQACREGSYDQTRTTPSAQAVTRSGGAGTEESEGRAGRKAADQTAPGWGRVCKHFPVDEFQIRQLLSSLQLATTTIAPRFLSPPFLSSPSLPSTCCVFAAAIPKTKAVCPMSKGPGTPSLDHVRQNES